MASASSLDIRLIGVEAPEPPVVEVDGHAGDGAMWKADLMMLTILVRSGRSGSSQSSSARSICDCRNELFRLNRDSCEFWRDADARKLTVVMGMFCTLSNSSSSDSLDDDFSDSQMGSAMVVLMIGGSGVML
jgi:hypothetical protein